MPPWGTSRTEWNVQLTPYEVRSQQRAAFLLGNSEVFQAGRLCPVTPEPKTLTVPGVEQSLKTYCRPGMRRGGKCHPRMRFEAWPGEGWLIPQACMDSCPCLPGLPALVAGSGWPCTLRGQVFAGVSQEVWLKPKQGGQPCTLLLCSDLAHAMQVAHLRREQTGAWLPEAGPPLVT